MTSRKACSRVDSLFTPRRLVGLCYVLALALWLAWVVVGSALMLNYKSGGRMPVGDIPLDELTFESFVNYNDDPWSTAPGEGDNWYLSTDNDPHILWDGEGYVETVTLRVEQLLPPGGVSLYYLTEGQTDYRETQRVYARIASDGSYVFDLGGVYVTGLRIDPDSVGGVPTRLMGIELNAPRPWYLRLLPDGGQWLLLAFGPVVAAAFAALVRRVAKGD